MQHSVVFEWIITGIVVIGSIYNAFGSRIGFLFWMVGNGLSIPYFALTGQTAFVWLNVAFMLTNAIGAYRTTLRSKPRA